MLVALLLSFVAAPQREPVEVRDPLPEVIETLRSGPGAVGFERAIQRLPELLAAPQRELVEGAAFVAGEYSRTECRDGLVEALRRDRVHLYGKRTRVRELALDALIRMDAALPIELLSDPQSQVEPAMLFAAVQCVRDRAQRYKGLEQLRQATRESDPAHWAAAIELVRERDADIGEALLLERPWFLSVDVVDHGGASTNESRRRPRSRSCVTNHFWPPPVDYSLALPEHSNELAAPSVKRCPYDPCSRPSSQRLSDAQVDAWRLRLLAELAPSVRPLLLEQLTVTTHALDQESLRAVIEEHAEKTRQHVHALADAIQSAGRMRSDSDVETRLRIRVELRDRRVDQSARLRRPASWPGVEISAFRRS